MRTGDLAQALPLLRQAVIYDQDNERLWSALGQATGDVGERLDAFRRVLAINPQQARVAAVLKHALMGEGQAALESDADRARGFFEEVTRIDPRDEVGWLGLASIEREPANLLHLLGEALRCNPASTSTMQWIERVKRQQPAAAAPEPVVVAAARGTILIVDDSPTVRKILSLTLEKEGYKVVAANDGDQALVALGKMLPDLIFLDITMPNMDGYEVCRRIKKNPKTASVPVVMLSGKDGFFDKMRGRMAGATEYLTKPFQAPDVLKSVASHCAQA
jgi:twitching motility two-component system response regulator PilG